MISYLVTVVIFVAIEFPAPRICLHGAGLLFALHLCKLFYLAIYRFSYRLTPAELAGGKTLSGAGFAADEFKFFAKKGVLARAGNQRTIAAVNRSFRKCTIYGALQPSEGIVASNRQRTLCAGDAG